MEKGRVRPLDSTICIKQCLIQQQLAQRAQGRRNVLMLTLNISGNEDFSASSYQTAAVSGFRFMTGSNLSMRNTYKSMTLHISLTCCRCSVLHLLKHLNQAQGSFTVLQTMCQKETVWL